MANPVFYVTTALPYPNGTPHIGHAYEAIAADALARFKRCDGYDVFFMTGTDEHGLKMQQAAQEKGVPVRDLVDRNVAQFQNMVEALNISCDRFIRTTDPDHRLTTQTMWEAMDTNGDIYKDRYSGWYSVRDEAYYQEQETEIRSDGVRYAVTTGTPVEWTAEESYFFRLSAYQGRLLDFYEKNPGFIAPVARRNEVVSFVKGGLEDLSISRTTFDWGIPVPGDPKHVMYVWIDALTNYVTGVGYPDIDTPMFRKYWPADIHVIGKDILRFHAVYWPAFLMSAGLPLPRQVFAHGFLNNDGEKMSKSVGNVVSPFELVDAFGADALRYFLLRSVPFSEDGSYSASAIITRMNADLANGLGNLAQRSLAMVAKNLAGRVPQKHSLTSADEEIFSAAAALLSQVRVDYDLLAFHRALEKIWAFIADINKYFTEQQPWVLKTQDPKRMETVLYVTLDAIRRIGLLVQPIAPTSAARLLDLLAVAENDRDFSAFDTPVAAGTELQEPQPVFPRYES